MIHIARTAVAALALVLLAACGGGDGATSSADHDQADVTFAQQMIPHHQQAVMMARLAETNDAGPEVTDLARRISSAQEPEIERMTGWLKDWDEQVMGSGDMGDGSGAMTGMMDAGQMSDLAAARGAAFDRLFLTQMIEHHTGAIEMARKEQSEGASKDAIALARAIEKAQTSEIAEMRKLLAG